MFIHDTEFPFTEDELHRGLALLDSDQDAREAARVLAETLRGQDYQGAWSVSDEAFAALALVSDDLRERVDAYMRARWKAWQPGLVRSAVHREGLAPGADATPSALRAVDQEIANLAAEWQRRCATVAEWVRRRKAGEILEGEYPPWEEGFEE